MPSETNRKCGECTACCEGWLSGEAHGHKFHEGTPCHFLGKRCTIYQKRPHDPCVTFRCRYLNDDSVPEWMRPDLCGAILFEKEKDGINWVQVAECGRKLDVRVLNWIVLNLVNRVNVRWQVDGGWYYCGSPEFGKLVATF